MDFSILEDIHQNRRGILVIGRTIERNGQKRHILGMTLEENARLCIIEPASQPDRLHRTKDRTQKARLKRNSDDPNTCLHCCEIRIGNRKCRISGGQGAPLSVGTVENYEAFALFCDMLNAGWIIPEWLKEYAWEDLMLITLNLPDVKRLPKCSGTTPVTLVHQPGPIRHTVEKSVTLHTGTPRAFRFTDHTGDTVSCYINNVVLFDVWETIGRQLEELRCQNRLPEDQLHAVRENTYKALQTSCPKGMCYIGIEYECSKEISLQFYTKEFLSSRPETSKGSAAFLMMRHKPDQKYGAHGLPLKGCVLQTPVSPGTVTVPSELLFYWEKADMWETAAK